MRPRGLHWSSRRNAETGRQFFRLRRDGKTVAVVKENFGSVWIVVGMPDDRRIRITRDREEAFAAGEDWANGRYR